MLRVTGFILIWSKWWVADSIEDVIHVTGLALQGQCFEPFRGLPEQNVVPNESFSAAFLRVSETSYIVQS